MHQAELARSHGVTAFCYWHYWFAGRRMLERVVDEVRDVGRPGLPVLPRLGERELAGDVGRRTRPVVHRADVPRGGGRPAALRRGRRSVPRPALPRESTGSRSSTSTARANCRTRRASPTAGVRLHRRPGSQGCSWWRRPSPAPTSGRRSRERVRRGRAVPALSVRGPPRVSGATRSAVRGRPPTGCCPRRPVASTSRRPSTPIGTGRRTSRPSATELISRSRPWSRTPTTPRGSAGGEPCTRGARRAVCRTGAQRRGAGCGP